MYPIKQVPPTAISAPDRRAEIAALLVNGLIRLRQANAQARAEGRPESGFDLAFHHPKSVHADTVNPLSESR